MVQTRTLEVLFFYFCIVRMAQLTKLKAMFCIRVKIRQRFTHDLVCTCVGEREGERDRERERYTERGREIEREGER